MWCAISRWMISRAEDTGKKPQRFISRHIGRCRACGEYARFAASLSSRLREERPELLARVPASISAIELEAESGSGGFAAVEGVRSKPRRPFFALRPLPVAAAALVIVAGGLVLYQAVLKGRSPSSEDRVAARAAVKDLTSVRDRLQVAVGTAESSLDRERRILEQSFSSAVEYLQARLNIKIERREPPSKSS